MPSFFERVLAAPEYVVDEVTPSIVFSSTSVTMTLRGQAFANAVSHCMLVATGTIVTGTRQTFSTISCTFPTIPVGAHRIKVQFAGMGWSPASPMFDAFPSPIISSIFPTLIPRVGGTVITVSGSDFSDIGMTCQFFVGTDFFKESSVTFVSSTRVTCIPPTSSTTLSNVGLALAISPFQNVLLDSPRATFIGRKAWNLRGFSAMNASSPSLFPNADEVVLQSCSPTIGTSGAVITVTGLGFLSGLDCYFGALISSASVESSTRLQCLIPAGAVPGFTTLRLGFSWYLSAGGLPFLILGEPSSVLLFDGQTSC
jgi:hypothetical protein